MEQYAYPNSYRYSRRQFNELARFYRAGRPCTIAGQLADVEKSTALRFLRRNGLIRKPAAPTIKAYMARTGCSESTAYRHKARGLL